MRAASTLPSGGAEFRPLVLSWLLIGIVAIGCIGWLFLPGIEFTLIGWRQPEYSHGWLIPIVTAFILWQRCNRILNAATAGSWIGTTMVAVGLLLLLLLTLGHIHLFMMAMLVLVLAGLGLAALGPGGMRYVWVPLFFLLFALPIPTSFYYLLATRLQLLSSWIGAGILELAGVSVFLEGNVIDLGTMKLQVAEACSGLRYLFPLAAFGFLCAWLYRAPLWARVAIFLATIPITIIMNSFRIAMTGLFVEYGNQELAEGFMHLFEGWIIFIGALAVLVALMWALARLSGTKGGLLDFDRINAAATHENRKQTNSLSLGLPLLLAMGLLVVAIPAKALIADRQEVSPQRPGLATFPLEIGPWHGTPQPMDKEVLQAVGADDHLLIDFTAADAAEPVNLWVAYYKAQDANGWVHTPTYCLPGAGWEFVELGDIAAPVSGSDGQLFRIKRAVVSNGNQRMLMYYWFEQRGRRFTDEVWSKIYNLIDAIRLSRSDGALVRILTPLAPGETPTEAEPRLNNFVATAYPLLEPHVGL